MTQEKEDSLKVLQDIKSIMDRSSRVLTLSGWSGIWAGAVALVASVIAHFWISDFKALPDNLKFDQLSSGVSLVEHLIVLALATFLFAVAGAFFFSYRKNKKENHKTFNTAAQRMIISMAIPMAAGAWLISIFLRDGNYDYLVPSSLVFYGLTLINTSKYTTSEIRWLGLLEVGLGCVAILFPRQDIYFWAFGFGVLHIVYGIIISRKYEKKAR